MSRRADFYRMQGLSFREYLDFEMSKKFEPFTLKDIVNHHVELSTEILRKLPSPLMHFKKYLRTGYYPFFREAGDLYSERIERVVETIIEYELPRLRGVNVSHTNYLKKILLVICHQAPFVPNMSELSRMTGIERNTIL